MEGDFSKPMLSTNDDIKIKAAFCPIFGESRYSRAMFWISEEEREQTTMRNGGLYQRFCFHLGLGIHLLRFHFLKSFTNFRAADSAPRERSLSNAKYRLKCICPFPLSVISSPERVHFCSKPILSLSRSECFPRDEAQQKKVK